MLLHKIKLRQKNTDLCELLYYLKEEFNLDQSTGCRKDTSYYGGTQGKLPPCGDLASPYVPSLEPVPERYSYVDAFNNGTLFPSLNLPFHLKVNADHAVNTPLNELQALSFVILELGLYLDTHPNDDEAFYLYQKYVELEEETRKKLERKGHSYQFYQKESAEEDSYTWVSDPWPWNKNER